MSLEGALAAHRFGLGARPGDIEKASADPKAWLLGQLRSNDFSARSGGLSSTPDLVSDLLKRRQAQQAKDKDAVKEFVREARQLYLREMAARFVTGFVTDEPFRERLVRFWSNHFTVSVSKPQCALFAGAFEREAIRPHVTGKFADMLIAVEQHPAMQLYLDNAQSIGPDSMAGRRTGKGLNENLGREILELHTLGVDGGYSQNDVIALAKILTGWSVDRGPGPMARMVSAMAGGAAEGGFRFYPIRHQPGDKTLLGRDYKEGYRGGVEALTDLAHHPATARHIATKLAVHFIADDPPKDSIARLEAAFRKSGGDLAVVSEAIVDDPAAWQPELRKFRTPVEYVTAAMRAAGGDRVAQIDEMTIRPFVGAVRAMGEMPFGAPSPKGWPDDAASWTGSEAVLERVEWANAAAAKLGAQSDPMKIAEQSLGPLLTADTRQAIARAASPAQGLAMFFASPEFQRR